tara:strand:+ start:3657 stop:4280 length:624 start_codon:yes stop_codon:yes gene_type:complete
MTSTIASSFEALKKYDKINVIDIGAARASFLAELERYFDLENVYSIGIDPFDHGEKDRYDKFYQACIDDVKEPVEMDFYKNSKDDQASSLCSPVKDKEAFSESMKVQVLNINDIIEENLPEATIHFLKIDAEGKDLHIVKSLKKEVLSRIKYIAVECPMTKPRFEEEFVKGQCIEYFKSINFEVFYTYDSSNGSDVSDIVFVNGIEL